MKNIIFLLFLFCQLNSLSAQSLNLYVEFEIEYDIEKLLPGLNADMKNKISNTVSVYSYIFCNNYSEFQRIGARKKDPSIAEGKITSRDSIVEYKDFNKKVKYRKSIINPELVSIEELTFDQKWDVDYQRTKIILGHLCYKATLKGADIPTVAWFAPDLPIADGPSIYYNLPGFILFVDFNAIMIKATKLEAFDSPKTIEMPESNKYLSPQEFEKLIRKNK